MIAPEIVAIPPTSVCSEADSYIDIGQEIVRCDSICKIAPLRRVHTTEDDIAFRHRTDRFGGVEVHAQRKYTLTSAERLDRTSANLHLRNPLLSIIPGRVQDAIQILVFDMVWVNKNKATYSEPRQLLDHDAAGAGTSDDCNLQRGKCPDGALSECLLCPPVIFTLLASLRRPYVDVVSNDKDGSERLSNGTVLKGSAKQASAGKEDHASVHPPFFEQAVEGCREFLIGDVIDLGETVKAAWMAMHLDNAGIALPDLRNQLVQNVGGPLHAVRSANRA